MKFLFQTSFSGVNPGKRAGKNMPGLWGVPLRYAYEEKVGWGKGPKPGRKIESGGGLGIYLMQVML
ncbi:hypothetical protein GCM10007924_31070 [Sneathiella chinensis]|uniref:Uncharacterized protein n=1 Tax=Sneathiella chinensis TaxID=349750 RepID=A0ABQ5U9N9_9PROT|nr:hypothetical protein GCM10007924_31070 [Sneathiella chinensis]